MLMRNLMMDLLDHGQNQNNNFKLNDVYFALDSVIERACSVVSHNAKFKNVQLVMKNTAKAEASKHLLQSVQGDD